jgi:hypothetical protein
MIEGGRPSDANQGRKMLRSFEIQDDLAIQERGAVEVVLHLDDGRRRWCYFMTPQALTQCGDWIEGTRTPIHYNAPYMIVISGGLDEGIIEKALRHIDRHGDLESCSMPLGADPSRSASSER